MTIGSLPGGLKTDSQLADLGEEVDGKPTRGIED